MKKTRTLRRSTMTYYKRWFTCIFLLFICIDAHASRELLKLYRDRLDAEVEAYYDVIWANGGFQNGWEFLPDDVPIIVTMLTDSAGSVINTILGIPVYPAGSLPPNISPSNPGRRYAGPLPPHGYGGAIIRNLQWVGEYLNLITPDSQGNTQLSRVVTGTEMDWMRLTGYRGIHKFQVVEGTSNVLNGMMIMHEGHTCVHPYSSTKSGCQVVSDLVRANYYRNEGVSWNGVVPYVGLGNQHLSGRQFFDNNQDGWGLHLSVDNAKLMFRELQAITGWPGMVYAADDASLFDVGFDKHWYLAPDKWENLRENYRISTPIGLLQAALQTEVMQMGAHVLQVAGARGRWRAPRR